MLKYILWADVLHWYFDDKILPYGLGLRFVRILKKPAIVEWLGSDIRNPEIEIQKNPFFKKAYNKIYDKSPEVQAKKTIALQKRFGQSGFSSLTCPDMSHFLMASYYKKNYSLRQRITLIPQEVSKRENQQLKICHAPSKKDVKGTAFIVKVIENLQEKGYELHFDLIHNVPHKEALIRIQEADIFIDQLILGVHGMAALEALSFNKAVLVYISDYMIPNLPDDTPLINVNMETLENKIIELINDPAKLKLIQSKGRKHIEKYFCTKQLTPKLVDIYHDLIQINK